VTGAIKPFFYGRASIAGLPADNGVFVDAVIVQGVNDYTVCGQTTVGANMTLFNSSSTGPGAYTLVIDTTKPECLNKKAQYTFFINSVRARAVTNPGFTVNGGTFHVDLDAAEVALVTNGAAGAPGAINKNAPDHHLMHLRGLLATPGALEGRLLAGQRDLHPRFAGSLGRLDPLYPLHPVAFPPDQHIGRLIPRQGTSPSSSIVLVARAQG